MHHKTSKSMPSSETTPGIEHSNPDREHARPMQLTRACRDVRDLRATSAKLSKDEV